MFAGSNGPVAAAFAGSLLPHSILGTSDPERTTAALEAWCADELAAEAAAVFHCAISVGVLFGVELGNGRRVAVKAHPRSVAAETLREFQTAQLHLADRDFPCPRPIAGPAPLAGTLATAEEWLDGGPGDFARPQVVGASAARSSRRSDAQRSRRPCTSSPTPPAASTASLGTSPARGSR